MSEKEIQEVLEELYAVRPELLNKKAKRLFNAIMKIADERDKFKEDFNKMKQKIKDKLDYFKKMGKDIHGHYYYEEEIELLQGLLEEE